MVAIMFKLFTAKVRITDPAAKLPPDGTWLALRLLTKEAAVTY